MFAFKTFVALALPLFAMATPLVEVRTDSPSTCTGGTLNCCQSSMTSSEASSGLAGLLGIPVILGALVGLNCDPISAIGIAGNTCQQQTLCCSGDNFGPSGSSSGFNLISLGCSPVNVIL